MTEILKYLTPAEVLLIINPTQPNLGELLRVTILDLANRGIIQISEQGISQHNHKEQLLEHEQLLFDQLSDETHLEKLSQRLKKSLKSGENFIIKYVYTNRISNYFESTFLQKIIGTKKLNEEGISLQQDLLELIDSTLTELRKRSQRDEIKIKEKMKILDRNKIILDNIQSVDRIFPKKERRSFYESYYFLNSVGMNIELSKQFDFIEQFELGDSDSLFSTSTETVFEAAAGFDTGGDGGSE
ncbi:hypothetical protein [Ekhidna sp.]